MLANTQAYDKDFCLSEFIIMNFDPTFRSAEIKISLNAFNAIIFTRTAMGLASLHFDYHKLVFCCCTKWSESLFLGGEERLQNFAHSVKSGEKHKLPSYLY